MNKYINNKDSLNIIKDLIVLENDSKNIYNKLVNKLDDGTLNLLFNMLIKIKTSINNIYLDPSIKIIRTIKDREYLKNGDLIEDLKSKYISANIKKHIYSHGKKQITYTLTKKVTYVVNFILFSDKIDTVYLNMCAMNIFSIIYFLETYRKPECKIKILELYIFLTDFKKQLPTSKKYTIGPENVNTGLTGPCRETTRIIIYRKEEFMKLVIHELLHALGLDIPNNLYKTYTTKLDEFFNIESTYNFNETYTEIWAVIVNILFFIAINNDDSMERNNVKKQINELFYKEIFFSCLQVIKILDFMSLSLKDLQDTKKNINFREETHVFCYYILKYLIFNNLSKFFKICGENIHFSPHQDLHDSDMIKLNRLIEIVITTFNNRKFINDFSEIESNFKLALSSKKFLSLKQTLRMTCIELA